MVLPSSDLPSRNEFEALPKAASCELDTLVFFGRGVAKCQFFGEQDVHRFGKEAGAGEVADVCFDHFFAR